MSSDAVLSPVEVRLIGAMVDAPGATRADLAARVKISERHVRRLLAREPVRQALDEAARAGVREAAAVLGRGAVRAASVLVQMVDGTIPPTNSRVSACRVALEALVALSEFASLEQRIGELERAWSQSRHGGLPS